MNTITLLTSDDSGATWGARLLLASFQREVTPPLFFFLHRGVNCDRGNTV